MHVTLGANMVQSTLHVDLAIATYIKSTWKCQHVLLSMSLTDTQSDQTLICKYSICIKSLCKSLMVILQLSLSHTLCYCGYLQMASYRVSFCPMSSTRELSLQFLYIINRRLEDRVTQGSLCAFQ